MTVLTSTRPPHVVVVGGGFTGAAVASNLAERYGLGDLAISVIEPRSFLGGGLAYSTDEPSHRVNVPASRMSLLSEQPEHFSQWLGRSGEIERDPESVWRNGDIYPRRRVFGRYVEEHLEPHIRNGRIVHEQGSATRIERTGSGWSIETSSGRSIAATVIVLAATHPSPGIPVTLAPVSGEPGFVADPYGAAALAQIDSHATVLIVGSGLSSADMIAELDRRGHRGNILVLSRHGLRSRGHPEVRGEPFGDFGLSSTTALGLLRHVRATVAHAGKSGVSWHSVFDKLRTEGQSIWSALSPDERVKLVRRLRVFWDVHRFRIAPQIEAILDRKTVDGTLATIAASLVSSGFDGGRFSVRFRRRGQRQIETLHVDSIINTTGPAHGAVLHDNPALKSLAGAGYIRADRLGLGLLTSADSRAVSTLGNPVRSIFVAGPLARGTFGELMGLPEVARHAQAAAAEIGAALDADRHRVPAAV